MFDMLRRSDMLSEMSLEDALTDALKEGPQRCLSKMPSPMLSEMSLEDALTDCSAIR